MPNDYFQFKKFLVKQDKAAFKVGTDSVMLGSWTDISNVESVLDIGTGTGLLSLMMAQRSNASVCGIEIDEASYMQAFENARESAWPERIEISHASLQEFIKQNRPGFDLIICNPPYFKGSMKSGDHSKDVARHDISLSLKKLIEGVTALLGAKGKFCLVLPSDSTEDFIESCRASGLFLIRVLVVIPTDSMPPKRHLLEFRRTPARLIESDEITIERSERHDYTDEYMKLTRDFYLNF